MDLLDLYHAHEHSLSVGDEYYETKYIEETRIPSEEKPKARLKIKKARFVPWEPYKAAPGHDRKGERPNVVPTLIPYSNGQNEAHGHNLPTTPELVDTRKHRNHNNNIEILPADDKMASLQKELNEVNRELEVERKLNQELKNMFLTSLSEDLQCQVEALAGDKIQLGRRLEEYCNRLAMGSEEVDQLRIERDVWKCKFMAQSIRSDELSHRTQTLLDMLKKGQQWLQEMNVSQLPPAAQQFAFMDLQSYIYRSPCDPKMLKRGPNYSNLTISCCKTCSGREIKLL